MDGPIGFSFAIVGLIFLARVEIRLKAIEAAVTPDAKPKGPFTEGQLIRGFTAFGIIFFLVRTAVEIWAHPVAWW